MKKNLFRGFALTLGITSLVYYGCQQEPEPELENPLAKLSAICDAKPQMGKQTANETLDEAVPYTVSLLRRKANDDGTFTWIWSVTNPKPGNGSNGTVQDLSHWGISLGDCASLKDIVQVSTSTDGNNWKNLEVSYKQDKSQDCYSSPVLKFDAGTSNTKTTYYKVILNKDFSVEKRDAYFKSGKNTGCGTFKICAIGCLKQA
ncbi:MAG TPA: hypothetical protein VGE26_01200 [Sphingobacteriaceae bacterium]